VCASSPSKQVRRRVCKDVFKTIVTKMAKYLTITTDVSAMPCPFDAVAILEREFGKGEGRGPCRRSAS
jgi:hypothetical protein